VSVIPHRVGYKIADHGGHISLLWGWRGREAVDVWSVSVRGERSIARKERERRVEEESVMRHLAVYLEIVGSQELG
jgi:hypothetical protein